MFSMRFGSFGMGKFLATEANQTREIWVFKYHSNTKLLRFLGHLVTNCAENT